MARDLTLLVGGYDQHGDGAVVGGDRADVGARHRVAVGVDAHAEALEPGADARADLGVVLADARGETTASTRPSAAA